MMLLSRTYLTPEQQALISAPCERQIFLSGPAGSGKTTVGVERILSLLEQGVPGERILLLAPQRSLATPYDQALRGPGSQAGSTVNLMTVGGLARRMVELFWPLVSEAAGFAQPDLPPTFLTLESAQYYMAHLVRPLFQQGYFESVTIERHRLYSQVLDNLNKAAVIGFPYTEIGERLKSAWIGEPAQARVYADAQYCASIFRQYCLEHNLLDFSLQIELFWQHLWGHPICHAHLTRSYRHLFYDNLEEDTPLAADLIRQWLPDFDSALLIYDQDGGYRRFLGADPEATWALRNLAEEQVCFSRSFVAAPEVTAFGDSLAAQLEPEHLGVVVTEAQPDAFALSYRLHRYYPDMLEWVTGEIATLVAQGMPPGEIVILAPYLGDALRYALVERLNRLGLPSRSHRPSRSLREEPATQCLLTLAKLAHPQWDLPLSHFDVAYALLYAIAGLDLVRAQLLAHHGYRPQVEARLTAFARLRSETQERITYQIGEDYERLRDWLERYQASPPQELDHFLSRLFGELLSQPGFGFHADYNAAMVAANLVESVQKFRWATTGPLAQAGTPLGKEYLEMVAEGVIAAQYLLPWQTAVEDAVFLAPAHTFLMRNQPVTVQFWLDVGGRGWYERLSQPLTHPHVLSRSWQLGLPWTAAEEAAAGRSALRSLALGLTRRCREHIYLGLSELNEQGYEHKGELLRALDRALRPQIQDGA